MSKTVLRPYQLNATAAAVKFAFEAPRDQRTALICAPTGVGKSVMIAATINDILKLYPRTRILMMTHSKELVEQNYKKACEMVNAKIGLWHAGLRRNEYDAQILFAGIDTVNNNPHLLKERHIIFIDEAHRVAPKPSTNYQNTAAAIRKFNPHAIFLGYTATPYRLGQGHLTNDWFESRTGHTYPAFWQQVIHDDTSTAAFNEFFDQGYLKRLVAKAPHNEIDVTSMRISSTQEYVKSDVEREVNNEDKIRAIVDEICEHGFDRRSWLVFAAGNKNAELIGAEIRKRGVTVGVITDSTPAATRKKMLEDYKAYKIRCLVNNDILTTGFDHAGVDLIAVVRVTASTALWVQMLGRGTRPVYAAGFDLSTKEGRLGSIFASGVYNCIVLDFAGNSKRLGAINDPVIPLPPSEKKRKQKAGDAALKICPECRCYVFASARTCPECDHDFPFNEQLKTEAGDDDLILEEEHVPDIRRLAVVSTKFNNRSYFTGESQTSTVEVIYNCGQSGKFTERLTFGKMTKRTKLWWQAFAGAMPPPMHNDDFLANYSNGAIKKLAVIEVYMNKRKTSRPEIITYGFTDNSTFNTDV